MNQLIISAEAQLCPRVHALPTQGKAQEGGHS